MKLGRDLLVSSRFWSILIAFMFIFTAQVSESRAEVDIEPGPQQDEEVASGDKCDRINNRIQKLEDRIEDANQQIEENNEEIEGLYDQIIQATLDMQEDLDSLEYWQGIYDEVCGPNPDNMYCHQLSLIVQDFQNAADGHAGQIEGYQEQIALLETQNEQLGAKIAQWQYELAGLYADLADCP